MSLNTIPAMIVMGISALLSYAFFSFQDIANALLLSICSFIFLTVTGLFAVGISYDNKVTSINVRAASLLFFMIFVAGNILFSLMDFKMQTYVVTGGVLLLLYLLIIYSVTRSRVL